MLSLMDTIMLPQSQITWIVTVWGPWMQYAILNSHIILVGIVQSVERYCIFGPEKG